MSARPSEPAAGHCDDFCRLWASLPCRRPAGRQRHVAL